MKQCFQSSGTRSNLQKLQVRRVRPDLRGSLATEQGRAGLASAPLCLRSQAQLGRYDCEPSGVLSAFLPLVAQKDPERGKAEWDSLAHHCASGLGPNLRAGGHKAQLRFPVVVEVVKVKVWVVVLKHLHVRHLRQQRPAASRRVRGGGSNSRSITPRANRIGD
eukprot:6892958-Pyramimonas_sp.AAC.2